VKVGDLVSLKDYCRGAGRLAIIVDVPFPDEKREAVKINYVDTGDTVAALTSNLVMVNENKNENEKKKNKSR
jgi:acyl-CoA hydrolase